MILICLNPFISHFLPIRLFAEKIVKSGEEVVFIGYSCIKDMVKKEGYRYVVLESCLDETLQKYKRNHEFDSLEKSFKRIHEELIEKMKIINPRLILFHISRFDVFFLPVHELGIDYMTYDMSFGKVSFAFSAPPSTSSTIPLGSWDIRSAWGWIKRLHRKINDLQWFSLREKYPYNEMWKIKKREGLKKGFCIDGFFIKGSHIKFTPSRIEFCPEKNVLYAGLCVKKPDFMEETISISKRENESLIYCTLGTMSNRYTKTRMFLEGLIEIIRKHPEFQLVISLGKRNEVFDTNNLPDNVKILDYIDQHEILKKADLVITHGGAGTVKECIYYEVPMIIAPSSYDQTGNAAKVQFHNIGLRNELMKRTYLERKLNRNLKEMNTEYLENQILRIIGDKKYKANIKELKKTIERDNELEQIIKSISS